MDFSVEIFLFKVAFVVGSMVLLDMYLSGYLDDGLF
jgi:hypothetical protein